jgi:hypothetical protein
MCIRHWKAAGDGTIVGERRLTLPFIGSPPDALNTSAALRQLTGFLASAVLADSGRSTFHTTTGCFAATCNNTFAAPSDIRRPCSQLRSVLAPMSISTANSFCGNSYSVRSCLIFAPVMAKAHEGVCLPRKVAPPSRTLATSSVNSLSFRESREYRHVSHARRLTNALYATPLRVIPCPRLAAW